MRFPARCALAALALALRAAGIFQPGEELCPTYRHEFFSKNLTRTTAFACGRSLSPADSRAAGEMQGWIAGERRRYGSGDYAFDPPECVCDSPWIDGLAALLAPWRDRCAGLVVYTVLLGRDDVEHLRSPPAQAPAGCSFLFADEATVMTLGVEVSDPPAEGGGSDGRPSLRYGLWNVLTVAAAGGAGLPYRTRSRNLLVLKVLPQLLFPWAELVLYADSRVQLSLDPRRLFRDLLSPSGACAAFWAAGRTKDGAPLRVGDWMAWEQDRVARSRADGSAGRAKRSAAVVSQLRGYADEMGLSSLLALPVLSPRLFLLSAADARCRSEAFAISCAWFGELHCFSESESAALVGALPWDSADASGRLLRDASGRALAVVLPSTQEELDGLPADLHYLKPFGHWRLESSTLAAAAAAEAPHPPVALSGSPAAPAALERLACVVPVYESAGAEALAALVARWEAREACEAVFIAGDALSDGGAAAALKLRRSGAPGEADVLEGGRRTSLLPLRLSAGAVSKENALQVASHALLRAWALSAQRRSDFAWFAVFAPDEEGGPGALARELPLLRDGGLRARTSADGSLALPAGVVAAIAPRLMRDAARATAADADSPCATRATGDSIRGLLLCAAAAKQAEGAGAVPSAAEEGVSAAGKAPSDAEKALPAAEKALLAAEKALPAAEKPPPAAEKAPPAPEEAPAGGPRATLVPVGEIAFSKGWASRVELSANDSTAYVFSNVCVTYNSANRIEHAERGLVFFAAPREDEAAYAAARRCVPCHNPTMTLDYNAQHEDRDRPWVPEPTANACGMHWLHHMEAPSLGALQRCFAAHAEELRVRGQTQDPRAAALAAVYEAPVLHLTFYEGNVGHQTFDTLLALATALTGAGEGVRATMLMQDPECPDRHFLCSVLRMLGALGEGKRLGPLLPFDAAADAPAQCFRRLVVPRYGLGRVPPRGAVDAAALRALHAALLRAARALAPAAGSGAATRVLLYGRKDAARRRWTNAAAVAARLRGLGLGGVEVVEVEDMSARSVEEQAALFYASDLVIVPHGAAMANAVFARPGTAFVEMSCAGYSHYGLYGLPAILGQPFLSYTPPEDRCRAVPGAAQGALDHDFHVDLRALLSALDELLRRHPEARAAAFPRQALSALSAAPPPPGAAYFLHAPLRCPKAPPPPPSAAAPAPPSAVAPFDPVMNGLRTVFAAPGALPEQRALAEDFLPCFASGAALRLGWRLRRVVGGDASAAEDISAYRVTVSDAHSGALLLDSGRVRGAQPPAVECVPSACAIGGAAAALPVGRKLSWSVAVWDAAGGGPSEATAPASFAVGPAAWRPTWFAHPRDAEIFAEAPTMTDALLRGGGDLEDLCARWRRRKPLPLLRATFRVRRGVQSALLLASGLGSFAALLNGQRLSSSSAADPPFADHSLRVAYRAYDVTALLEPGDNAAAFALGAGLWDPLPLVGGIVKHALNPRGPPVAAAQLYVSYEDGGAEVLRAETGGMRWQALPGFLLASDLFTGEEVDLGALARLAGWAEAGGAPAAPWVNATAYEADGTAAAWRRAKAAAYGPGAGAAPEPAAPDAPPLSYRLPAIGAAEPLSIPPVMPAERLAPRNATHLGGGRWLLDYGRGMSGALSFDGGLPPPLRPEERPRGHRYAAAGGAAVATVVYGDSLTPEGDVNLALVAGHGLHDAIEGRPKARSRGGPCFPGDHGDALLQRDVFVLAEGGGGPAGAAAPRPEAMFAAHGFRYAEVCCFASLGGRAPSAVARRTLLEEWGAFASSSGALNGAYALTRNALRSNAVGAQWDCPHRERLQYGGDLVATSYSALHLFDAEAFYAKALRDWRDAQWRNGAFTETAPYMQLNDAMGPGGGSGPVEWASLPAALSARHYQAYGAEAESAAALPGLVRWAAFLAARVGPFLRGRADGERFCLGDWLSLMQPDCALSTRVFQLAAHRSVAYHAGAALRRMRRGGRPRDGACGSAAACEALREEHLRAAGELRRGMAAEHLRGADFGRMHHHFTPGADAGLFLRIVPAEARCAALGRLVAFRRDPRRVRWPGATEREAGIGDYSQAGMVNGIFSLRWGLHALSEGGFHGDAVAAAAHDTFPGYQYMLDHGATTLWETWWRSEDLYSRNHPMLGAVAHWLAASVAGVSLAGDAVGADKLLLWLQLPFKEDGALLLSHAAAEQGTRRGTARIRWRASAAAAGEGLRVEVEAEVPPATRATLRLPEGAAWAGEAGAGAARRGAAGWEPCEPPAPEEGRALELELRSGAYRLEVVVPRGGGGGAAAAAARGEGACADGGEAAWAADDAFHLV